MGHIAHGSHTLLRHNGKAEARDELMDAVVDFLVQMVRTAGKHDYLASLRTGLCDDLLRLGSKLGTEFCHRLKGCIHGIRHLCPQRIAAQQLLHGGHHILFAVEVKVRIQEILRMQPLVIGTHQLRIVGDHGTIVVVVGIRFL